MLKSQNKDQDNGRHWCSHNDPENGCKVAWAKTANGSSGRKKWNDNQAWAAYLDIFSRRRIHFPRFLCGSTGRVLHSCGTTNFHAQKRPWLSANQWKFQESILDTKWIKMKSRLHNSHLFRPVTKPESLGDFTRLASPPTSKTANTAQRTILQLKDPNSWAQRKSRIRWLRPICQRLQKFPHRFLADLPASNNQYVTINPPPFAMYRHLRSIDNTTGAIFCSWGNRTALRLLRMWFSVRGDDPPGSQASNHAGENLSTDGHGGDTWNSSPT